MPLLDVTDLLTDPDFVTLQLKCSRLTQTVGANGIAANAQEDFTFTGVVTSDAGDVLTRLAEGERIVGSITVVTRFVLRDGGAGTTADVVTAYGRCYTVTQVNDYSMYGRGFVEARCELIPLLG